MKKSSDQIEMVDLKNQYFKIKSEIEESISRVINNANFINGQEVHEFSENLSKYLNVNYVIPCANGTDALQIAFMALGLNPGDEVIVPAFTYVATAEVISLLKLKPIMVDVSSNDFNISVENIKNAITKKTKAIVPVHLFGQCVDIEPILKLARENNIFIVEDAAQALGATYKFSDGTDMFAGTIGDIGCTSFFPSKNLGCFGDGGAIFTNNIFLAEKIRMIANHGQEKKYVHKYIGVNSRLDTLQAAILNVKLKYLDEYSLARREAANQYNLQLKDIKEIKLPFRSHFSSHVFHQYTIQVKNGNRDKLKKYLEGNGIPAMIYYPIPLNQQEAFISVGNTVGDLGNTKLLCETVLSLPMHTELKTDHITHVANTIKAFFSNI
jgi:dTDP-4-amino-4,6-dideoxygalactose transaminase